MAVTDVRLLFKDDAAAELARADVRRLAAVDPGWKNGDAAALAIARFRAGAGVLAVHPHGAWAALECTGDTLYGHGIVSNDAEAFSELVEYIDALARHAGMARIRFGSYRPGWLRYAPRFGYAHVGDGYFEKALAA